MTDWQTIAVLICIVVAGHFVSRRLLKMLRGSESHRCGSCASPSSSHPETKPIVPLDAADQRR